MCISCGCKMYKDDMGDKRTITTQDLAAAAVAMSQSGQEVLDEMNAGLKEVKASDIEEEMTKMKGQS